MTYDFMVVHQRSDDRWVVSRMANAWDMMGRPKRKIENVVRMQVYRTAGHYDNKACAVQWAKAHRERQATAGNRVPHLLLQLADGTTETVDE